jgi:ubiquinone/menaquinone biosynthesis C-methylase UbiE
MDEKSVKSAYQSVIVAKSYDKKRFLSLKGRLTDYLERRAFRKGLSHCSKGNLFLDLACGTGRFTRILIEEGHKVVGADISMSMIREASKKISGNNIIGFVCCDAEDLPFKDKVFGNLSTIRFLNHLTQSARIKVLKEASRVTREKIIAAYFNPYTFQGFRRWITGYIHRDLDNCLKMSPKMESQAAQLRIDRSYPMLPIISGTTIIICKSKNTFSQTR